MMKELTLIYFIFAKYNAFNFEEFFNDCIDAKEEIDIFNWSAKLNEIIRVQKINIFFLRKKM